MATTPTRARSSQASAFGCGRAPNKSRAGPTSLRISSAFPQALPRESGQQAPRIRVVAAKVQASRPARATRVVYRSVINCFLVPLARFRLTGGPAFTLTPSRPWTPRRPRHVTTAAARATRGPWEAKNLARTRKREQMGERQLSRNRRPLSRAATRSATRPSWGSRGGPVPGSTDC